MIEQSLRETMEEERVNQNHQALREFALSDISGEQTSIARLAINANNFEIKPSLIQMIQQNQFEGHSMEDPNANSANFSKICDTIKLNGVSDDAIKFRLFPFSLMMQKWTMGESAK